MKFIKILSLLVLPASLLISDPTFVEPTKINQSTIQIDGLLNDEIWQNAKAYDQFFTFQPVIGDTMSKPTYAYTAYDENNLYFAFKCIDPNPEDIIGSLTKRDNIFSEDWVMVMLDSYNDQESCYEFGVNPYGVQGDLVFSGNGDDASHDFIWESAAQRTPTGYNVEMAIPLKSIRFQPDDVVEMGICFLRYSPKSSLKGSYPAFDPEGGGLLTQFKKIKYEGLNYKRNLELLPSITQNIKYAHDNGEFKQDMNRNELGVTAKMGLTPTLTLDATYNPDFSQIEADAGQVTKNLRTSVYYSEKRPFFLEGSEKFNLGGTHFFSPIMKTVHTRNIIDPQAGIKLSGKIGDSGSISSLIAVDESPKNDEDLVNKNAFHGIFRYKNLRDNGSYIGGLFANKTLGGNTYNTAAADFKHQFRGKNTISGNAIYTLTDESNQADASHNMDLEYMYSDKQYTIHLSGHDISKDFRLPVGFVGRDGLSKASGFIFKNFYPDKEFLQRLQLGLITNFKHDKYDNMNEYMIQAKHQYYLPGNTFFMNWFNYGNEVYCNQLFRNDETGYILNSQFIRNLHFSLYQKIGYATWYDEDDPLQAFKTFSNVELEYKPSSKFQSSLSYTRSFYKEADNKEELMDYQIYRNRTTYQINKYLFLRSTIEYNAYEKQLLTDFLVSFTYIPGTVIHVGYGSMYDRAQWDSNQRDYIDADHFLEMNRGLFMKASYNWRM